jgi:hypothetical protein
MTNLVSRAVNGDENPADILRQAGIQSMQSRAALVPHLTDAMPPTLDEMDSDTEDELLKAEKTLKKAGKATRLEFTNWEDAETFFRARNLKPIMPAVPVVRSDWYIKKALEFIENKGWIAGSAALWAVSDGDWRYDDIDVFAKTSAEFDELHKKLAAATPDYLIEKLEKQTKFALSSLFRPTVPSTIGTSLPTINLVNPCGADWNEPINFLKNFDWTICAVSLVDDGYAYAYSPEHLKQNRLMLLSRQYPQTIIARMLKYMKRGFHVDTDSLYILGCDETYPFMRELEIINLASTIPNGEQLTIKAVYESLLDDGQSSGDSYYNEREGEWEYE